MAAYGKAIPQSIIGRDAPRTGNGKRQGAAPLPEASTCAFTAEHAEKRVILQCKTRPRRLTPATNGRGVPQELPSCPATQSSP